jgi:hypothetical protein
VSGLFVLSVTCEKTKFAKKTKLKIKKLRTIAECFDLENDILNFFFGIYKSREKSKTQ